MKILFSTPFPPAKETGACKVVLELAEELELLGWQCKVVGPPEVAATLPLSQQNLLPNERLRQYLLQNAEEYDVIDYEHTQLPFPRSDFSNRPLFVARSVMLQHHIESYPIPIGRGLKAKVGQFIKGPKRNKRLRQAIKKCSYCVQQADLVNLCNDDEKKTLIQHGISEDKMVVLPYGISRTRRPLFDAVSSTIPATPIVAFVGSFDYRKGANEFPIIIEKVAKQIPNVRFRLLGTSGMFPTEQSVLAHFPKQLRRYVEIIPKFPANKLPELLAPCSVGLFPSYIEGFGFGVLEMLAASLPVIAYDVPGPRMMLSRDYLVRPSASSEVSHKIVALLQDKKKLSEARLWAKQCSQQFQWNEIAEATSEIYSHHIQQRKAKQILLVK